MIGRSLWFQHGLLASVDYVIMSHMQIYRAPGLIHLLRRRSSVGRSTPFYSVGGQEDCEYGSSGQFLLADSEMNSARIPSNDLLADGEPQFCSGDPLVVKKA